MSKLALPKFTISLNFYGEEWKDCYIKIDRPRADVITQMEQDFQSENVNSNDVLQRVRELIKSHFVEGKGLDADGNMVDIEASDFDEVFDMTFFTIALRKLVEGNYE